MLNSGNVTTQDPDDQPFQHYSTKHRIVAWISRNIFDHFRYTVRSGLLKGMRRRGGFAWLPEAIMARTRTPESYFWMKQNLTGMVIYDIGAYHGLLTMFFARQGTQVISYEPNSRNHARLTENIQLNQLKNVMVRKTGVGSKTEVATMVASPSMMGGASIESETVAGLVKSHGPMLSEQIPITTLDEDVQKMALPRPDFIKIDVEGQELAVLMGARNTLLAHHPILFLEMHGETMNLKRQKVAALVGYLAELGYQNIEHVETGTKLTQANSAVAAEGHLYCT